MRTSFACLANYPRVPVAEWFRLEDDDDDPLNEYNHYGLFRVDGSSKPSLSAFKDLAASNGGAPGFCADLTPPTIKIIAPVPGQRFEDRVDFRVSANDVGGVGLARVSLLSDLTPDLIRHFTDSLANDQVYGLAPWFGSRDLKLGKHTLRVAALDKNGNVANATVEVEKVKPGTLRGTRAARYAMPKKVLAKNCTKKARPRKCTANFGLLKPAVAGGPSINGKVSVEWQWFNKKRQWRKLAGGTKSANKPLTFTATLPQKGRWRVRVVYKGAEEYKGTTSKFFTFTAK
jgi:hypothetical protein